MNGYDTYYYAWHDIMDEALTLQEDSARIMISGTVDGQEKIYQLSEEEFSLVTAPENGVTFQIQISDIKKIVDREFPQFNNLSENVYGQKVTVTYNAVLNEKAAEDEKFIINPYMPVSLIVSSSVAARSEVTSADIGPKINPARVIIASLASNVRNSTGNLNTRETTNARAANIAIPTIFCKLIFLLFIIIPFSQKGDRYLK